MIHIVYAIALIMGEVRDTCYRAAAWGERCSGSGGLSDWPGDFSLTRERALCLSLQPGATITLFISHLYVSVKAVIDEFLSAPQWITTGIDEFLERV